METASQIVAVPAQAMANIEKFEREVEGSPGLQSRLAYARAWYASQDDSGQWHFGPSKFIGYEGMTADAYLNDAEDERDGRRTETQLRSWFKEVDPGSELYQELSTRLFALLARYGKTPSTKMRINVRRKSQLQPQEVSPEAANDKIVELIAAVARTLPAPQLRNLREQIEDISIVEQ